MVISYPIHCWHPFREKCYDHVFAFAWTTHKLILRASTSARARAEVLRIRNHHHHQPPRAAKDGICELPRSTLKRECGLCAGTISDILHNNSLRCIMTEREREKERRRWRWSEEKIMIVFAASFSSSPQSIQYLNSGALRGEIHFMHARNSVPVICHH